MFRTYCFAAFMVGFFLALQVQGAINGIEVKAYTEATKPFLIDPSPSAVSLDNYSYGQEAADGKPTVKEVKDYIRVIFGKDWKVAWAVAENECNHRRPEWPNCVNSWAKERSIGIFQINIAKENGHGAKVHWSKIPGSDLREKEAYLQSWKNNILIAHVIFTHSGFQPWTAYTSGNYLNDL